MGVELLGRINDMMCIVSLSWPIASKEAAEV